MQEKKAAERLSENIREAGDMARETINRAQQNSSRAVEGLRSYQLKLVSAAQASMNAMFDYAQDLVQARTMNELVEASSEHSRRQLEMMTDQTRDLTNAAQTLVTNTAAPLTSVFAQHSA
jgi:hypothetical protein